jgi:hypothetical protein
MLIESRWVRSMSNATVDPQRSQQTAIYPTITAHVQDEEALQSWEQPEAQMTSMNPMTALVILLLGMMMSAHHQDSTVSTMIHSQLGMLFSGFALARGLTYVLLYIEPPTSHFPARPPTEIVAAFCLIAGGIMFMNSAHDIVSAIEYNGLDAMTIVTITTGLTGILMAWEVFCFALKGWAIRVEKAGAGSPLL